MVTNICRCCLVEDHSTDNTDLLNMENETFIHQHQRMSYVDAFSDVNSEPGDNPLTILSSEVKRICKTCAVGLESAYFFRKVSVNAVYLSNSFCYCCRLENIDKNVRFFNMNTEVFVHNQQSITFTGIFFAVNNNYIEDSRKIFNSAASLCEYCAFLLESAYVLQKMCQMATDLLNSTYSAPPATNQTDCELNQREESQDAGSGVVAVSKKSFSEQRKTFNEPSNLTRHNRVQHIELTHQCRMCIKTFLSPYHLKVHIDTTHHLSKHHLCNICQKTYMSAKSLQKHIANVHGNKQHPCDKCSKVYKSLQALHAHKQVKHLNKLWSCKSCTKVYQSAKGLTHHNNTIHLKKLYPCKKCPVVFNADYTFRIHFESEHLNNTYTCEYCAKEFKSSVQLGQHKRNMHAKVSLTCYENLKLPNH